MRPIIVFVSLLLYPAAAGLAQARADDLLAEAAARTPVALNVFEQFALQTNPTLQQARALVRQSGGLAQQAGLLPNPIVGYQGEEIRGGSFDGGEQGGFVQQDFILGGKLGLRRNVYRQQQRADEIGVEEQRYRVLSNVGQQFYTALAAQETVNVRRRLLSLAADALETAHQLANVGQADAPDVLQSEVEQEQAQLEYIAAERAFIREFRTLAALAGKPDLPLAPLAGNLGNTPQIDADHLADQIAVDSPSIKRAQQDVVRAEATLKSAKRESIPDLSIHAGLQNNFEPLNGATSTPVGVQGFVTAGVPLPIFNRNQGNVAAAQADLERAQAEVNRVQLLLRQAAQPVLQDYLTARTVAARYKDEIIPHAARAYELYMAKYRQMAAAYPAVIVSQRTLFDLQIAYIGVLRSLWIDSVALQNFTLSNGLAAPQPRSDASTVTNPYNVGVGAQ
ncbi:MAG: TolC family protein [Acidobacteriaceae bacterium]|nr:TolC family protein [Acidobacteriaceae bacterium]